MNKKLTIIKYIYIFFVSTSISLRVIFICDYALSYHAFSERLLDEKNPI